MLRKLHYCHSHLQQSRHGENKSIVLVAVAGEEEEINPRYQETWYEKKLKHKDSTYTRKLVKTMNPHSLRSPARCWRGKGGGPAAAMAAL
jgi:hypothetical protein